MSSEIGWEELEEKVGKIEPGKILELNLLRKGLSNRFPRTGVVTDSSSPDLDRRTLTNLDQ